MKITIPTNVLKKALETVGKAATPTVSSNIYEGILFSARDNQLEIQANNHYIAVKTIVPATIEEEGTVVVKAPFLIELIRKMSAETISMESAADANVLRIRGGRSENEVVLGNPNEFPLVDNIDESSKAVIGGDQLRDMYNLTRYTVAGDNQQPIFSGLLLEIKGNAARMVGTDTHRLACREVALAEEGKAVQIVIPERVLADFIRLLPADDTLPVTIYWEREKVAFAFDNVYFRSVLIEGVYPDYERVFPTEYQAQAVLDRRELTNALERVALISRDMLYKTVTMKWTEDTLSLSAVNAETGSAEEEVACQFTGEPLEIVFNCFYLLDILKHSSGDNITLHILQNGPMLVEQEFDDLYRYVVTPMRGR